MSKVILSNNPDLSFLPSFKEEKECVLPIILKQNGHFNWEANSFLTEYGGGYLTYNVKPKYNTIVKKAYCLNIFCSFMEKENIKLNEVSDSTMYLYIKSLKKRKCNDETIIKHGRTALEYIINLSQNNPDWKLASQVGTSEYGIHYSLKKYRHGGINREYPYHSSFNGLIHIRREAEYVRDHELSMWYEAIETTSYHPNLDDFLIARWQAFITLQEITGSRISEVHKITRVMIKQAVKNLFNGKPIVIKGIPILKGKYKGKTRNVQVDGESLQIVMLYIDMVEKKFEDIDHDFIFVNLTTGTPLSLSYLKNYAKKVINGSKYCNALRHLSNHSFRHRFITINVAKEIVKLSNSGSFSNILTVAANACRKISMHASNSALSHYVHLAADLINSDKNNVLEAPLSYEATFLQSLISVKELHDMGKIDDKDALYSFLNIANNFKNQ
ncbi:site-specific integrase [Vibrio harveyi]|uniref:site-specific integrase n=1 Tax=Vibrio harveyi TaxID=669 RepID=UPI0040697904